LAFVSNLVPAAAAILQRVPGPASTTPGGAAGRAAIDSGITLNEAVLGRIGKGGALGLQSSTIYSYTLDVPAGQAWPFNLSEQIAALRLQGLRSSHFEQLGNNLGFRVIIEPAFRIPECTPITSPSDLPCDFAVADRPNTAGFFPIACEPCEASVIGL